MKAVAAIVLVLSLGIWVYFYEADMRLTAPETTVVVGACLAVALLARWVWIRFRTRAAKGDAASKGAKTPGIAVVFCLGAGGLFPAGHAAWSQAPQEPAAGMMACSPDRPVVSQEGSVVLRAWAPGKTLAAGAYKWTVTAGEITGQGSEVHWTFHGVDPGMYRAEVTTGNDTLTQNCSLRVVVTEPLRGEFPRETARTFLLPDQQEDTTYGLYSYVLFGSRPAESGRARYLSVIQAYLDRTNDLAELKDRIAHAKLNVTYVPLGTAAPANSDAAWLLEHYDYARARVLLDALPGDRKDGVFLVSCLKPLSGGPSPPYVVQNLTTVPTDPPDLISWWVREFLNQASQERFWDSKTSEMLTLRLRTTIAVLAAGLPDVQKSVTSWIAWSH